MCFTKRVIFPGMFVSIFWAWQAFKRYFRGVFRLFSLFNSPRASFWGLEKLFMLFLTKKRNDRNFQK